MHTNATDMLQAGRFPSLLHFAILSLAFLCVSAPLIRYHPSFGPWWLLLLYAGISAPCLIWFKSLWSENTGQFYIYILIYYIIVLACIGTLHVSALYAVPHALIVNPAGQNALLACKKSLSFLALYLMFPVMLLANILLMRKLSILWVVRCLAVTVFCSCLAAIYQGGIDTGFMHLWPNRVQGLSVDPNSMAMTLYLSIPILLIGLLYEKRPVIRLLYGVLIYLCLDAMKFTESRTFAAGLVIFLSLLPLTMAMTMKGRTIPLRVALGSMTIIPYVVILFFPSVLMDIFAWLGGAGTRLMVSYGKLMDGGVFSLFHLGETRGEQFDLAFHLTKLSPLAGWGPAGFYREASSMQVLLDGSLRPLPIDSPLNHYLMLSADFGVPAMILNAALILIPLLLGMKAFHQMRGMRQRWGIAVVVVSQLLFLFLIAVVPPSYFLAPLWLWTLQLALLYVTADNNGIIFRFPSMGIGKKIILISSTLMLLMIIVGTYKVAWSSKYAYSVRLEHPWWAK